MKHIYFLPGYQTSGKKFECIENFYKNSTEFLPINWEWNENMDIPAFFEEKIRILTEDVGGKILIADSMGANLAWSLVNKFPELHYVMTNPVFSPDQIIEQELILPEMRSKFFLATKDTIKNKNIKLIISKFDTTLDPNWYKKVFDDSVSVLEIPDEHKIVRIAEWMPSIHQLILESFEREISTSIIN